MFNVQCSMLLSIIIPVYNVEPYFRTCLESVFRQGLNEDDFEVIIVDDGSTDQSIDSVQPLIRLHAHVSVVRQPHHSLSVARNRGLERAVGQYVLFLDSDDLLFEASLPFLLQQAVSTQADVVVADFLKLTTRRINHLLHHDVSCMQKPGTTVVKTGEQLLLEDLNPEECYVWRTLYKHSFLQTHHLSFIPGIKFQDVPFTHEAYARAGKCLRVAWLLTIYRVGHHDSSKPRFQQKEAMDFVQVISHTWQLAHHASFSPSMQQKIRDDVFVSFSSLIYSTLRFIPDKAARVSIMSNLLSITPQLDFRNGMKQRLTTYLLRHCPYLYMHLRHHYTRCLLKRQ